MTLMKSLAPWVCQRFNDTLFEYIKIFLQMFYEKQVLLPLIKIEGIKYSESNSIPKFHGQEALGSF